ncbi:MAG: ribonuclease III [Rickettsiaceae bacterium]|nr:MAG: ribonuclease III [Rickettsiaceae bacterium]
MNENIELIQQNIGYKFNNVQLLIQSLSHPSLRQYDTLKKINNDNERLELLGDAVVGLIITELIFKQYPDYNEGKLAIIKSHLVCKDTLCQIAKNINLPEFIIMTCGEEMSGGRNNPSNLENTIEALMAAIYLDGDLISVKFVIQKLWYDFLKHANLVESDPKSALQELVQKLGYSKPVYEMIGKEGPAHLPIFKVSVTALNNCQISIGNSLKAAEKAAAKELLKILQHHKNHT